MISVCMSTYNGEQFIYKQMKSIYDQTLAADEVIICDDCSTDRTIKIIEEFIDQYSLQDSWKLYKNEQNKGYPGNFYYTMELCSGDIVFLADQDDLWKNNKIEKMATIMESNGDIGLLASKWGIIDQDDKILKNVSCRKCKDVLVKVSVKDILYYYDWPGMCMCYRKSVGDWVLERVKSSVLAHDLALGLTTAEAGKFFCMSQVEQYHRRHDANLAIEEHRIAKLLNKGRKLKEINRYLEQLQAILDSNCLEKKDNVEAVEHKKRIMLERMDNLVNGYRKGIIKQFWKNRKAIRLTTLICDLIVCKS